MHFKLFIFTLLFSVDLLANFSWVQIGVNGLTCSACSRSVEMSIRKLDFVKDVEMNLEHTEGKITFKEGATVDIEKIAQAVFDAGFSVRYLHAGFMFSHQEVTNDFCLKDQENVYQFLIAEHKIMNGETTLKFIGKKFLPQKELKEWKTKLNGKCKSEAKKLYYVTL